MQTFMLFAMFAVATACAWYETCCSAFPMVDTNWKYSSKCTTAFATWVPIVLVVILFSVVMCYLQKKCCFKQVPARARTRPNGEVALNFDHAGSYRNFHDLTDSPSSAHIGPSGVGQVGVGTAVAPTGGAWGAKFDPNTGQPIPKFDPNTGKQNWGHAVGETKI